VSKWNRWVATNIHLGQSSPLGCNGFHCIECLHEMGKLLLKLAPGEPLPLVHELAYFDNLMRLDPLLESALSLCVHDLISCSMFNVISVELYWCQLLCKFDVSNNGGKYDQMRSILSTWCRPRNGGILSSKLLSPTTLVMM